MNVLSSKAHSVRLRTAPTATSTHIQHTVGEGAGVFKYPIVPLRAASSDGHHMGLDKELISAPITASGKGQIGGEVGGRIPPPT